jgi:hypothetical protein
MMRKCHDRQGHEEGSVVDGIRPYVTARYYAISGSGGWMKSEIKRFRKKCCSTWEDPETWAPRGDVHKNVASNWILQFYIRF